MTDRKLLEKAEEAMKNAYAPYSRFKVGAALECSDGTVYAGCNIENPSFPVTICAEVSAVSSAVSDGKRSFKRLAVISDGKDYCFPCGQCRQLLSEFGLDLEVLCARSDGRYVSYPLSALLPMSFGKEHVER
jgi:cytidine deaminase